MRWKAVATLALILAVAAGCKQQIFMTEGEYYDYRAAGLPGNLEGDLQAPPVTAHEGGPPPATVDHPERQPRHLCLAEAIALALEHGTPGSPLLNGTTNDILLALPPGASTPATRVAPENSIRVLALDPAAAGTDIEASLSKFDARWQTSMTWQRTNEPIGGNILTDLQNGDQAIFSSSLLKPLPTGGVAGITFNTQYTFLSEPPAGVVNPSYRPMLQFQFEQPLLQGFGVEINQLRQTHPGSILTPFNNSSRVDGILITRVRFDQERAEFERQVNYLLANVEVAYWNLYSAYWYLYSRQQGLRLAFETLCFAQARFEAGRISLKEVAEARARYELFRGERLEALGQVLEAEHQLRGLIGLPPEDGEQLVPIDKPTLAPYLPDWCTALDEALNLRPELQIARQDLKLRQFDVLNQKNLLMPDLRFTSTYDVNGLGTHLDGGPDDPNNALHSLATNEFHNWSLGLRLDVPIGFRDAQAGLRAARLRLSQSYLTLRDQECRARRYLDQQYRAVAQSYAQIQAQRSRREAHALQLKVHFKELQLCKDLTADLFILLETQRLWADALRSEYAAIAEYNSALARFEFAKGTILEHDNVVVSEGLLPRCAQVRAVDHEKQRSSALLLREKANPVEHPVYATADGSFSGLPELPPATAPSLPALFAGQPPMPPDEARLPGPQTQTQVAVQLAAPQPATVAPSIVPGSWATTGNGAAPANAAGQSPPTHQGLIPRGIALLQPRQAVPSTAERVAAAPVTPAAAEAPAGSAPPDTHRGLLTHLGLVHPGQANSGTTPDTVVAPATPAASEPVVSSPAVTAHRGLLAQLGLVHPGQVETATAEAAPVVPIPPAASEPVVSSPAATAHQGLLAHLGLIHPGQANSSTTLETVVAPATPTASEPIVSSPAATAHRGLLAQLGLVHPGQVETATAETGPVAPITPAASEAVVSSPAAATHRGLLTRGIALFQRGEAGADTPQGMRLAPIAQEPSESPVVSSQGPQRPGVVGGAAVTLGTPVLGPVPTANPVGIGVWRSAGAAEGTAVAPRAAGHWDDGKTGGDEDVRPASYAARGSE